MVQIVCIDTGTLRPNCEVNDIVAIHEDDVELSCSGYGDFKVINITRLSATQINDIFQPKIPEVRIAYKPLSPPSKWTFVQPEENNIDEVKEVWLHTDSNWYFLEDRPKYSIIIPLNVSNVDDLENITIPENIKIQLIGQVSNEKIHLKSVNMMIVKDLN